MSIKPAKQLRLPYGRGDCTTLAPRTEHPVEEGLLEQILERDNLLHALRQVERNGGSAGVDGMPVKKLRGYLKRHWPEVRAAILKGRYRPQPVKRVVAFGSLAYRQCWIGSSSKRYIKYYRRYGSRSFRIIAMVSVLTEAPTKQWPRLNGTSVGVTDGLWILIWRNSLTGSTTTC